MPGAAITGREARLMHPCRATRQVDQKGNGMKNMHVRTVLGPLMAAAAIAFLMAAPPAMAEGFRSITTVTADYYFPTDTTGAGYYVASDEVFLARLLPVLTLEAKVTRNDFPGGPQHIVSLGPVYNFSDTIYAVAVYGLGFDAASSILHEVNGSFNWETDTSAAFVNFKWNYFTADGSWYVLPSIGGKFHLLPALGLFGEYFMSWNNARQVTGAFWGQADYAISPAFTLLGGFTVSYSRDLGYSLIAGTDLAITENIGLKLTLSFLSNVVEYLTAATPTTAYGMEGLVSLDWKF
jgi:hypothetical protein